MAWKSATGPEPNPPTPALHVIMLTANDSEEDIVQGGLSSGATDYVTKPPGRRELQARIDVGVRVVDAAE